MNPDEYYVFKPTLKQGVRPILQKMMGSKVFKLIYGVAHAVQLVSALLQHGPEHLKTVREEMGRWMEAHEYHSLRQMQGRMNLTRCPDPQAFERANYMRVLHSWRP